jgi:hypothetical protein
MRQVFRESWLAGAQSLALNHQKLYLYCDGSARFRQSDCIAASAGLVLIPSPISVVNSDDEQYFHVDEAYALIITQAGGAIGTPFDAELLAGLSACYVAKALTDVCRVFVF